MNNLIKTYNTSPITLNKAETMGTISATQCPYKGGRAVFKARFYVHLFNDSIVYFDDEVCLSQGIQRLKHEEGNQTVDFTLTPNPANEQVEVLFKNYSIEKIIIVLINSIGETIYEKENLTSSSHLIIDTKKYAAGFYQVKLFSNGILVNSKKLILIK